VATFGTFVDGVSLKASELNDFFASKVIVPTLRQGVTITGIQGNNIFYYVVNKVVYGFFTVGGNSAGTAGTRIEVDLPVTATSSSVRVIGSGFFRDASPVSVRVVRIVQVSTTRMAFLTDTATSLTSYLGTTNGPAVTLAANDYVCGSFVYKAA
jgi:hypothetical protein